VVFLAYAHNQSAKKNHLLPPPQCATSTDLYCHIVVFLAYTHNGGAQKTITPFATMCRSNHSLLPHYYYIVVFLAYAHNIAVQYALYSYHSVSPDPHPVTTM
jgi:hypothetical protein